MHLVIDVGNTKVKFGIFKASVLKHNDSCLLEDFSAILRDISKSFPTIKSAIVASVGNLTLDQVEQLQNQFPTMVLDHTTKVPFQNKYSTPHTLGVDRIALISAAVKQFPGQNVLVVDAGTCVTYDFVNAENEYLGGAISPGVRMRYQALNNYTANLPLLNPKAPDSFIGNDTQNSIHSGVLQGTGNEIDGFIEAYKSKFEDLTVILTGGDAHFLRDCIKNDIFANPNFLLEGLNHLLEFNTF